MERKNFSSDLYILELASKNLDQPKRRPFVIQRSEKSAQYQFNIPRILYQTTQK